MKRTRKPYMVDTGNVTVHCATLEQAIDDYNAWIDFYVKHWGSYGAERTITLSKDNTVIYSTELFDEA